MKEKTNRESVVIHPIHENPKNCWAVLLCVVGISLNMGFTLLAGKLNFVLYLDTIGTVLAAVLGGYLPAIIVGFLTNIIKGIYDESSLYYGVLNVLIALSASLLAEKGWFKKPLTILGSILIFTIIGGGLGTCIPWYLEGVQLETETLSEKIYNMGLFTLPFSQLLANLLTDFLDKALTVLLVLLVVKLMPEKSKHIFRFSNWQQIPLSEEDTAAARSGNFRIVSMRTKIILVLTVAMILIAIAAMWISVLLFRSATVKDYIKLAEGTARLAVNVIDGDKVNDYIANGYEEEDYAETMKFLEDLLQSSPEIQYVYVYQIQDDGCHVVFDVDTEEVKGDPAGAIVSFDYAFNEYLPELKNGEEIEPIISNESFGYLLTIYKPVFDSNGICQCYVGIDIEMQQLTYNERSFFVEMASLFLGFFVLILAFSWWLIEYHFILPVNTMALSAGAFAYNTEEERESSVENIKELGIRTGDELENLYYAFTKTSEDSIRYVADIQDKTETISKMQKALIMVLADLVESRDQNTGDHVRKTAAYVKIILNRLKEKGEYADQLTDEFIANVVDSAPLHDIGKITIPDAILNKPAKLTDEEFAIMKSHSQAGGDIIAQVIEIVPDSAYLYEAKKLALYHHEKWNGKGYPYGLAGEEIPLSARVMAVADVFDALVSERSYKKPFPFEKAMDIIREGSGSHFDPKIAEAFLEAEDEVRKVSENFKNMRSSIHITSTGAFNS
ncbi:MAG: HD domain-containing phosphohydrolase [Oscillospiraceae bacterium]